MLNRPAAESSSQLIPSAMDIAGLTVANLRGTAGLPITVEVPLAPVASAFINARAGGFGGVPRAVGRRSHA